MVFSQNYENQPENSLKLWNDNIRSRNCISLHEPRHCIY